MEFITERAGGVEKDPSGLAEEFRLIADAGLLIASLSSQPCDFDPKLGERRSINTFDLLRRMGAANLSVGRLFEGHLNAVKLVQLYGSSHSQDMMADAVIGGGLLGVWGADGNQPLGFRRQEDRLRLYGEKAFASGLGVVRLAVVTMREDYQDPDAPSQLALVDVTDFARQDPSVWTAAGMRATLSGRYVFDGLEIPSDQLLGVPGDYEQEPYFEGGIWRYCAVQLGGAEALIGLWQSILSSRGRLDDPFQMSRFARAVGLCRAMASLVRETALLVDAASGADKCTVDAAVSAALLTRQFVEDSCVEVLMLSEKSLGVAAHEAGPVDRIRRDLSTYLRQASPDGKLLKAGQLITSGAGLVGW